MANYLVENTTIDTDDDAAEARLADLHKRGIRLLCTCTTPPLEMYLAKTSSSFIPKRMPGTGPRHAPTCTSYEPPPSLSGLAPLLGTAIVEDPDRGTTMLRLAFSLSRRVGQAPPAAGTGEAADSIAGKRTRLTLRSLLHYLWEQAQLNHWNPRWEGKRTWPVVRSHVLAAASAISTAGGPLGSRLYLPEPFFAERKAEIAQRRATHLAAVAPKFGEGRDAVLIVVGEVKSITPSRAGFQMLIKHAPDFPFAVSADLKRRFDSRFRAELDLWDQREENRLVVAATFTLTDSDYAHVDELTGMVVTKNWIPIEAPADEQLITTLTASRRTFFRVMRYALPASTPVATAVATDTTPSPVGLYILPTPLGASYRHALEELTSASQYPAWFWQPSAAPAFDLPPISGFSAMTLPAADTSAKANADSETSNREREREPEAVS
jgi:hypothetical protein